MTDLQAAWSAKSRKAQQRIDIPSEYKRAASAARTDDIIQIMRLYFSRMDQHFDSSKKDPNFKHVSAALYGTARI